MFISSFICVRLSRPNHYQQTIFINNFHKQFKSRSIKSAYIKSIIFYIYNIRKAGWILNELKIGKM